ncbi:4-alpha-glucanotransferase, partial [bacterium]|nr:4-alpha-glucanotransferase [bacterium]
PSGTSEHRPDRVRAHSVCYVGTHDNEPAAAWAALGGADADYAMRCLGVYDVARLPEALLRAGMGSRAELFVAQMQDYLGLGKGCRMNTPGTSSGNWQWRMLSGEASKKLAKSIHETTRIYGRL